MQGHCGISAWLANSAIVHSVSWDPLGRYERHDVVWPVFSHEPFVTRGERGEFVMFFTSTLWDGTKAAAAAGYRDSGGEPPVVGGRAGGTCTNCSSGETSSGTGCSTRDWGRVLPTYMSYTTTPSDSSSWSPPVAVPPVQLSPLIDSNLVAHIFPNGSLIGLFRNDDDRGSIHVVLAAHWRNASSYVEHGAATHPLEPPLEDPSIWVDNMGRFHCLSHSFDDCGYHSFSADGFNWSFAPGDGESASESLCAFNYSVDFADGETYTYPRRERPHVVLGSDGLTPIALTSAVTYRASTDASFTLLQPIAQDEYQHQYQHHHQHHLPSPWPQQTQEQRETARGRRQESTGAAGHDHADVATCSAGGNQLQVSRKDHAATLSRTGVEGLIAFNGSHFRSDDFFLSLRVNDDDPVNLTTAQDTDSRRSCALMSAVCGSGNRSAAAEFLYRCGGSGSDTNCASQAWAEASFQVTVEYTLTENEEGGIVVNKSFAEVCKLTEVAVGQPQECDTAVDLRLLSVSIWAGLVVL